MLINGLIPCTSWAVLIDDFIIENEDAQSIVNDGLAKHDSFVLFHHEIGKYDWALFKKLILKHIDDKIVLKCKVAFRDKSPYAAQYYYKNM